jgi:hypothetical protein
VSTLAPVGPIEPELAERVASALRRLRRVTAYEEAAIGERQHLETVSARLLPHPLDLDKIIRFEAHLTRQLYHALHELEAMRIRAARAGGAAAPSGRHRRGGRIRWARNDDRLRRRNADDRARTRA